jgi:PPP family 3-phenylpropionic acid transporter
MSGGYVPWPEPEDNVVETRSAPAAAPEDAHFLEYHKRDPHLLVHKAFYCLSCAAIAAYIPFLVQWMTQSRGLTFSEAGGIFAIAQFITMFLSPLVARLADTSEAWRRRTFIGAQVLWVVALLAMRHSTTFPQIAACNLLAEVCATTIFPLLDASIQRLLTAVHGDASRYGNTRAWGAVGWGLGGWGFGALYDADGNKERFSLLFAAFMVPSICLALFIPMERRPATNASDKAACAALLRWDVAAFGLVIMLCSLLLTTLDLFRFSYLETLGASNQLMGISLLAASVSETPFFFFTAFILNKVSVGRAMVVVAAGYTARFLWYAYLSSPVYTVPAELLHGLTFALGWAAATKYITEILPPELASMGQGLLCSVIWCVGGLGGSLFGGGMLQTFGFRVMWLAGAALGGCAAGIMVLQLALCRGSKANGGSGGGEPPKGTAETGKDAGPEGH